MKKKMHLMVIAALVLAALACNAPLTNEESVETEPTAQPTAASDEQPVPTEELAPTPTQAPANDEPDPTATSDSDAGGLTRTDGPTNDTQFREFRDELVEAIVARDYDALEGLLGDVYVLALYQSEGTEYDSTEEAVTAIEEEVAVPTAFVSYTLGANTTDYIEPDPMGMWDPAVDVVAAIPFTGFGADGESDALVIIAQNPDDGGYYWYATLLVPQGFAN